MLLDTSVLVEFLAGTGPNRMAERLLEMSGDVTWYASPIHLGELADAARRKRLDPDDIVARAKTLVELVPLDADIAIEASRLKAEARKHRGSQNFSLIDGITLASARSCGMRMLTLDKEFRVFPDVVVLER